MVILRITCFCFNQASDVGIKSEYAACEQESLSDVHNSPGGHISMYEVREEREYDAA